MGGACSKYGERRNANRVLVRNQLEDLGSLGSGMEHGLTQDKNRRWALLNAVMERWVPENAMNWLTSLRIVNFSRWTLLQGVNYSTFPGRLRKTTDAVSLWSDFKTRNFKMYEKPLEENRHLMC
jgi:hypothetical protein